MKVAENSGGRGPEGGSPMSEARLATIVGWLATLGSVSMYVAYIDQISRNLHGVKGSVVQPAATLVACILWALYGALRRPRDWPIVCANLPGNILSAITVATGW